MRHAAEELKAQTKDIAKDATKDLAKDLAKEALSHSLVLALGPVILFLTKRAKETGVRMLGWTADALDKLRLHLSKEPAKTTFRAEEVAAECGCTPEQAERLLAFTGFRHDGEIWALSDAKE